MDELQILVKAIISENSEQSMDSQLASLTKKLANAHEISLKVNLDDKSVQAVQSQLQAIAKQVSTTSSAAKGSGTSIKVFDSTQLKADGQRYFNGVRDIISRVQKEFGKMGQVDVTNVFKDAKGNIQSFTASVTKADGVVEKFNFELAKIKNGTRNLTGFVQSNSVLSDKSAGSELEKTLNFLNRIDTKIADITSKTLKNTSKPLLGNMEQFNQYQTRLTEVKNRIEEIKKSNATLSGEHKREIASMVADLQRYAKELQNSAYAATDLNAATFANKKAELQTALQTDIKKWQSSGIFGGEFEAAVNQAKVALDNALDPSDLEAYKHQLALLQQRFKQFKLDSTASGKIIEADTLKANIQTAQKRILNLKSTYSSFVSDPDLLANWEALFDSSKMISSKKELQNLNANIRKFEQELISAGKHSRSLFDELKANAVKMGTWMILGGVIAGIMRGVTGLYDAVVDLDTAMTELKKVTNETDEAYDNFLSNAADKAVQIGTSYSDFVTSTADFARLGYTMDDSAKLAEVANIYAVVGDEISGVDDATTSIISTMKAFGIEADDAMSIVDKFNEVGNNFAISSGGIGEAMQRSASAMAAANNTIDESIALIVAANNVVQDPTMVGTMWKTVSMRIRGATTELEEAGLETEYMAESTASLQKKIKALTNVDGLGGFDIMTDADNFKSTYEIILGISEVWEDMSDIDQAALLELLAGKRQGNALSAAITNMGDAVDAMKTSVESEGSAMEEHEKWMDSIAAKQQQFQAQYEALANAILDSELIKGVYDAGTGLLGWLTQLVDTLGALPTLLATVTPFFDKIQLFKTDSSKNWLGSGTGIQFAWNSNKAAIETDIRLLEEYNSKISGLGKTQNDLTQRQIIWNDTIGRGSNKLRDSVRVTDDATVSTDAYKTSMNGASGSTIAMGIASKAAAVGVQVLRTALNMLINLGIGLAIKAIISGVTKLINKQKELREQSIEAGRAAAEDNAELLELAQSYLTLSDAVSAGTGSQEELVSIQDELIRYLKTQGIAVQNLAGDYDDLRASIIGAAIEAMQTNISTALAGAQESKEQAIDDLTRFYGGTTVYSASGDGVTEALEYLDSLGFSGISVGTKGGTLVVPNSLTWDAFSEASFDEAMENYRYIEEAMNAVRKEYGSDNPVFTMLAEAYNEYDEHLKDAIDDINNANEMIAQSWLLAAEASGSPTSLAEFQTFRNTIIENLKNDKDFDVDGTFTAEELVDNALQENSVYSDYLKQLEEQELTATEIQNKRQAIAESLVPKNYEDLEPGTSAHFHALDEWLSEVEGIKEYLRSLSDEDFELAYELVVDGDISGFDELQDTIQANQLTKKLSDEQISEYRELFDNYNDVLSEANNLGVDLSKTVYGNIDTSNRQILEWTDENLATYKDAIESWGMTVDELRGSFSTVIGSSEEFDGVEIAFSPMLQTENGAVLLDSNTVYEYIYGLIDEAGDNWTTEDLLRLDTEGLEIDGQIVKGLLADVGETARETGAAMHYTGELGAVANAYDVLSKAADEAGVSVGALQYYFEHSVSKYERTAKNLQSSIETLWKSEDFEDSKEDLIELSKTLDGITAENIRDLATDGSTLAAILDEDGMSAEFLANILQSMAEGGDGLSLITTDALKLNDALEGMVGKFDQVTEAKSRYDAAMSVEEKDTDFKSYAEAFEELNAQFEAGTTNSNAFWAAAEFLFGSEQLATWGWSDGLDEIYTAMQNNKAVFSDADSAGAGFIERLYQMAQAGELVNEEGEQLLEIGKDSSGAYFFDIDPDNIEEIAKKMGITEEAALACLKALSMWGDIDFYDLTEVAEVIEEIGLSCETATGKAINVDRLTEQLLTLGKTEKEIHDVITALGEMDGVQLFTITEDVDGLTQSLQNLGLATEDGVTIKVDYEGLADLLSNLGYTKDEAEKLITKLGEADNISLANADGEVKDVSDALEYIDTLTFTEVTTEIGTVTDAVKDLDESSTDNVVSEIDAIGEAADVTVTKVYGIKDALQDVNGQTATVYYKVEKKGSILGSIFGFAKGTKSAPAGDALVGEEGTELVQSDNGAYLVGTNGAEIVHLNEGDRVYTAEQTKRMLNGSGRKISGIIPAYAHGRVNTSGLRVETNKTGSTGTPYKVNVDVTADPTDLEDALKETLEKMEEELNEILGNFEHNIFLLEKNDGTPEEIIAIYKAMQKKVHEQAEAYRKLGLDDTSDYIQELQKKWWDYQDTIEDILHDIYKTAVKEHENAISLFEHQYDVLDGLRNSDGMSENLEKQIEEQRKIQQLAHDEAQRLRELGVDENDDAIQECIDAWWDAEESIRDINSKIADNVLDTFDDFIEYADDFDLWADLDFTKVDYLKQKIAAINKLFKDGVLTLKEYNELLRETQLDIYNEQKDALEEIIEKTMELVQQEAEDQIDALEDQIDKYKKIIDLKKEALATSKDEESYEKEVAKRVAEIAKIQAKIAQLDRDDSREANAEKQQLAQELAELQEELADYQADYSYNAQVDALDKEADTFEDTKDKEIKKVEDSVATEEAVYNAAIARIDSDWDALYQDLIEWNRKYGDMIDGEDSITTAWQTAKAAAQEYGSVVAALDGINSNIAYEEQEIASQKANEEAIHRIIKEMYSNSQAHHSADTAGKARLNKRNLELGAQLAQYGITAVRGDDGVWYVDRVGGTKLYDKYKEYTYHTGGIVGEDALKPNEVLTKLEKGEVVMTENQFSGLFGRIKECVSGIVDGIVHGLTSSEPAVSEVVRSITNNDMDTDNSVHEDGIVIQNEFNVQGMDEENMKQFAEYYSDYTIDKLISAKKRKGLKNGVGSHMLR